MSIELQDPGRRLETAPYNAELGVRVERFDRDHVRIRVMKKAVELLASGC